MNAGIICLISLCVVLIAMNGWLFGRDQVNRLDIEKLYDAVAQLEKDNAKLRSTIDRVNDKVETTAHTQEEAADALAKQIEKRWDNGLQSMLGWNPYDRGESEGN
jgi:hypothetical protein